MNWITTNQLMQAMVNNVRTGGNPIQLIQQIAGRKPQAAQFMQMVQGKNVQQLQTMAENIAKERGTTIQQVAQQLGMQIPGGK